MSGLRGVFLDAATIDCPLIKPDCVEDWTVHETTAPEQTAERIASADVAFTNKVRIGKAELDAAVDLKLIVVAATGYDIIDSGSCRERGIAIANSPDYSVSSVPEHALALMFAVARRIAALHRDATQGAWSASPIFCLLGHPQFELAGRSAGLIGSGSLGRATGKLCEAIGMEVSYSARSDGGDDELPRKPLPELLADSDIVSLHCPLDAGNAGMFDASLLSRMKKGSILINTARGGLIDPQALVDALESGHLGGAGIDVLEREPPPADHPLLRCTHPGLVVTPHVAWASREAQERLARMVADTADRFFSGAPVHLVS